MNAQINSPSSTQQRNNLMNDVMHAATATTTLFARHRLCSLRTLGYSAELCTLTISTLLLLYHALKGHKDGRPAVPPDANNCNQDSPARSLRRDVSTILLDQITARSSIKSTTRDPLDLTKPVPRSPYADGRSWFCPKRLVDRPSVAHVWAWADMHVTHDGRQATDYGPGGTARQQQSSMNHLRSRCRSRSGAYMYTCQKADFGRRSPHQLRKSWKTRQEVAKRV